MVNESKAESLFSVYIVTGVSGGFLVFLSKVHHTCVHTEGESKLLLLQKLLLSGACIARLILLVLITDCVLWLQVINVLHFKPWLVNCFY